MITLILGGAASGKTNFVQECVKHFPSCHFYGTAVRFEGDEELKKRITYLKQNRAASLKTFESPTTLDEFVKNSMGVPSVVIDCVSLWLGNVLTLNFAQYSCEQIDKHIHIECEHFLSLMATLSESGTQVFIVSNEVGLGTPPSHESGRLFRQTLGQLNQLLAAKSTYVCQLFAGIPILIKDASPAEFSPLSIGHRQLFEKVSR